MNTIQFRYIKTVEANAIHEHFLAIVDSKDVTVLWKDGEWYLDRCLLLSKHFVRREDYWQPLFYIPSIGGLGLFGGPGNWEFEGLRKIHGIHYVLKYVDPRDIKTWENFKKNQHRIIRWMNRKLRYNPEASLM